MTLPVFPSPAELPGIAWNWTRSPTSSTSLQTAKSGLQYAAANWQTSIYKYTGVYNFLRSDATDELQTLFGFLENLQGMFGNFLFSDPEDSSVVSQALGTGDGTTTIFPLVRAYAGNTQGGIVANTIGAIYLDGVAQATPAVWTPSQIGRYGTDSLTFVTAPTTGQVITGDFSYYFPCRMMQDDPKFENFLARVWDLQELDFQTVK